MRKIGSLLMAILLVFALCGSALAAEERWSVYAAESQTNGNLIVIGRSGYQNAEDMNFTASTDKGELVIPEKMKLLNREFTNPASLRDVGTSWFVIMENGNNNQNENLRASIRSLLKEMANSLVLDNDNGALVPCVENPTVALQGTDDFRNRLKSDQQVVTDVTALNDTIDYVMRYIAKNRNDLMPNVAVVIVGEAFGIKNDQLDKIENTLKDYSTITTYIVCMLPNENDKGWVENATKLRNMADSTIGGHGYLITDPSTSEINKTVETIVARERDMLIMELQPKTWDSSTVGQLITITQTTAGGMSMSSSFKLPDGEFALWKARIDAHKGDDGGNTGLTFMPSSSKGYSIYTGQVEETKSTGISVEVLVGVIVGALVLILLIVYLVVRNGKKGKSTATTVHGVPAGQSAAKASSGGPSVTLKGDDGSTYTASMKNNRLIIGRDSRRGAMLVIPNDGKVSGAHVLLEKQGNAMMATDQGSTNGTKVNGNKISGATVLSQGASIGIGSHTYTITWRG